MARGRLGYTPTIMEVRASYILSIKGNISISIHSIEDVIAAGKAHGALREDLYGCLYFYLSEQFRSFAERIKRFHVTFHVFDCDARDLARDILSGQLESRGLPKDTHFDRIDVSGNIIVIQSISSIPNPSSLIGRLSP